MPISLVCKSHKNKGPSYNSEFEEKNLKYADCKSVCFLMSSNHQDRESSRAKGNFGK